MNKYLYTAALLFGLALFAAHGVDAAFLKFTPTSANLTTGSTTQIAVTVDSDGQEVLSSDVYVIYDPKILDVQSVVYGTYFPSVQHNIASGKITIRGHVQDAATSRKGAGTLATVTFRALSAGTANLSFFCDLSAPDTSKIVKNDINATNIIICTQNNLSTVTVTTPTSTPTPRPSISGAPGGSITPTTAGSGSNGGNNSGSSGSQGGPGNGGNANIGGNGSTGSGNTGTGGTNGTPKPTALPKTGSLDNLNAMAITGTVLFIVGGIASLIL